MAIKKKKSRKTTKAAGVARRTVAKTPGLTAGEWFEKLAAVQARLRGPDGCPWDREQTHVSLRTYLIEEAYEVLEALESGDDAKFAEEMGDLLLQIVFHSQIAKEEGRFSVSDVIHEVHDKMVRRHPHVFGEKRAKDSAEVLKNWEQLKKEERAAAGHKAGHKNGSGSKEEPRAASLLDGVSKALPAALEGFQLTRRAARIGFDWENLEGVFEKMNEEAGELRQALSVKDSKKAEEEMGDLLFAAVNLGRYLHIDPEIALKKANTKFSTRFRRMEELAAESGKALADVPRTQMEELWDTAKREEKGAAPALTEARKA
ncbi:MAG TPA: nucleoside triphosphate pyrophosphohydrolase [Candidatus Acidoferrum sp.]|nr:nucleoside triphosphate pyrophosphohydrolase [Candidatus Acidoferrum sp.]